MTTDFTRFGPYHTAKIIKYLVIATSVISLLAALTEPLMHYFFGTAGLQQWLGLSRLVLSKGYIWQPATYFFIQNLDFQGLNVFFLLSLAFDMYILWVLGSELIERLGTRSFLKLYFFSGIVAGIIALLVMHATGKFWLLAGPSAVLLSLFTLWTLFNGDTRLHLLFMFPIQAKWLFLAVVLAVLLIPLSHLDWVHLSLYLTGILYGYLYGTLAWGLNSPFAWLPSFKNPFLKKEQPKAKIYDLKGKPVDPKEEEAFVDAMLAKISKYGEEALTLKERERLNKISTKRRKR